MNILVIPVQSVSDLITNYDRKSNDGERNSAVVKLRMIGVIQVLSSV